MLLLLLACLFVWFFVVVFACLVSFIIFTCVNQRLAIPTGKLENKLPKVLLSFFVPKGLTEIGN